MMRNGGVTGGGSADAERLKDIRRLRVPAVGAAFIIGLLLVTYWLSGRDVVGPPPRREDLVRVAGTVERMRIKKDDGGCFNLSVRFDTERGPIQAGNTDLCRALNRVEPLPAGAPVTLLIERAGGENVIWEMTSGDRRLVAYERMRATRTREELSHRKMRSLVALLCLPFASFLAFWLWMELQGLARRGR